MKEHEKKILYLIIIPSYPKSYLLLVTLLKRQETGFTSVFTSLSGFRWATVAVMTLRSPKVAASYPTGAKKLGPREVGKATYLSRNHLYLLQTYNYLLISCKRAKTSEKIHRDN